MKQISSLKKVYRRVNRSVYSDPAHRGDGKKGRFPVLQTVNQVYKRT